MDPEDNENSTEAFERAFQESSPDSYYILRLFVSGMTQRSIDAITNIRSVCEHHLCGRYELEVIDLYQRPDLASADDIIAAPTLVKQLPEPLRRFIGDLSDTERVLVGLGLKRREP